MASVQENVISEKALVNLIKQSQINILEAVAIWDAKPVKIIELSLHFNTRDAWRLKQLYDKIYRAMVTKEISAIEAGEDYFFKPIDFLNWLQEKRLQPSSNLPLTLEEVEDIATEENPESSKNHKRPHPAELARVQAVAYAKGRLSENPDLTLEELLEDEEFQVYTYRKDGNTKYNPETIDGWLQDAIPKFKRKVGRPKNQAKRFSMSF